MPVLLFSSVGYIHIVFLSNRSSSNLPIINVHIGFQQEIRLEICCFPLVSLYFVILLYNALLKFLDALKKSLNQPNESLMEVEIYWENMSFLLYFQYLCIW